MLWAWLLLLTMDTSAAPLLLDRVAPASANLAIMARWLLLAPSLKPEPLWSTLLLPAAVPLPLLPLPCPANPKGIIRDASTAVSMPQLKWRLLLPRVTEPMALISGASG